MTVFNLKGFEAEAEVLGQLREVRYSGGGLTIREVDLETAKAIVDKLSTGLEVVGLDGETQVHGYAAEEGPPQLQAPPPPPPAPAKVEKKAMAKKAEPAKKKQAAAKAKAKPAAKEEPRKVGPAPVAQETAPEPEPEPAPEDNVVPLRDDGDSDDLVAQLAKKGKLIDVVAALKDAGFDDADKLIAKCEEIKDKVPVLKRIPSIPDRVKRVWERLSA